MLKSIRTALTVAAVTLSLSGLATNAMADDTQWQKTHPRREQVNNRLANQNKRIHQERKQGEITKAQAAKLHRDDRAIRKEERSEEHTSELQSRSDLVCRLLLEKKKQTTDTQLPKQETTRTQRHHTIYPNHVQNNMAIIAYP